MQSPTDAGRASVSPRARGGYEVAVPWKNGTLGEATTRADRTGRGRGRAAQPLRVMSVGKTIRVTHPEPGVTEFDTTAGSTYALSPASTTR